MMCLKYIQYMLKAFQNNNVELMTKTTLVWSVQKFAHGPELQTKWVILS